jgi:hypothetical protein
VLKKAERAPPWIAPVGRIAGMETMKFGGWQRLNAE